MADSINTPAATSKQHVFGDNLFHISPRTFTLKQSNCRFVNTSVNYVVITNHIFHNLYEHNITLLFINLNTTYYNMLHTRRFIVRLNKPLLPTPLYSDNRYVTLDDTAEKLLSTRKACIPEIIIKSILLSFRCEWFSVLCMSFPLPSLAASVRQTLRK